MRSRFLPKKVFSEAFFVTSLDKYFGLNSVTQNVQNQKYFEFFFFQFGIVNMHNAISWQWYSSLNMELVCVFFFFYAMV